MVFTKQSKKLTTGLCQIYNLHDCKKRNAIKILQFLQSILECSLFTTSLPQFLQSLITCDKGLQKIQQKCGGQNNAINDRVNYNQNICSVYKILVDPQKEQHLISLYFQDADILKNVMVKDFEYFVDRDHSFSESIKKTQQRADILWMEQLTSATG